VLRAAEVVVVSVRDDDVADVLGLQPELAQATDDGPLDVVLETRVDQDDALARGEGSG
jgi:hypothetical protein